MSSKQEQLKLSDSEMASWETRVIFGDRYGDVAIPDWLVPAYHRFRSDVMHPKFPCFFGTQAERRGEMFYSFVIGADLSDLPRTMAKFSQLSGERDHEKSNLALFFEPDPAPLGHDEYRKRFWQVLQYLHDHDPTITKHSELLEPDHPDWEFEFAGLQMFVVGCTPSYQRRRSRNLGPGMIMLFQPRSVFVDAITQKAIGSQARDQVRKRLVEWDGVTHHPDLGVYGDPENREWKQYFLPDDDDPSAGRCPFLSRKREQERITQLAVKALNVAVVRPSAGPGLTIVDRLVRYAEEVPDQVALRYLVDGETVEEALTYRQLDQQARALADRLREKAEPGDRAVLLLPSGLDYVVSLFACFYAGIIAVPAFPPEPQHQQNFDRLRSIVSDCEPRLLLTDMTHYDATASFVLDHNLEHAIFLRVERRTDAAASAATAVSPEAVAFLQYTSGSTSTPKGVMVSHGNIAANERLIAEAMKFGADDVMVSWAPLYHDMGLIGGLFAPIYHGFPLVLMSPQAFLERPSRWLKAISNYRGTAGGGPDFAFQLCIDRVRESQLQELDLSSWRVAYCGAEPIRPETMASFADHFAGAGFRADALYPCYGLAEGTLMASGVQPLSGARTRYFDSEALSQGEAVLSSSGTGIIDCGEAQKGHGISIVDPQTLAPCADGHIGEIWLSGPSLAKGYWKNRKATREAFVDGPHGDVSLRTGDLGFLLEGRLFVSGRLKDLIIVRGQNYYPQDIEKAVGDRVDALRKGRISAFPVAAGGEETIGIAAEVSPAKFERLGAEAILQSIRSAVSASHGEAPGLVLLLPPGDLPRTSSGKLRRSACVPEWLGGSISPLAYRYVEDNGISDRPPYAAPADELEGKIAAIWEEIFDIATVGRDDDFVSLGGQSILAARLAARLTEIFGVPVSPAIAYSAPTIVGQAQFVRSRSRPVGVPASAWREGQRVPLTHEQDALWFLWRLEPLSAAYNVARTLRIEGEIDEDLMLASIKALLTRHEALRARFVEIDGIPHQEFGVQPAFEWASSDLSTPASDARLDAARSILVGDIAKPFDLISGPILRVHLVKSGSNLSLIQFVTHHIVADAHSADIVLSELAAIYSAACRGQEAPLPAIPFSYGDYAVGQRAAGKDADEWQRQLAYWRSYLGDNPDLAAIATDSLPVGDHKGIGRTLERELTPSIAELVRGLASRSRTTPFVVMLSAFLLLVGRYGNQRHAQVGVPTAGRDFPDTQDLVGDFVKMLTIRGDVSGDIKIQFFIRHIHQGLIDGQLNQEVSFRELVEALRPERDASATPFFNATFNFKNRGKTPDLSFGNAMVRPETEAARPVAFDLMVDVDEFDQTFSLSWSYRPDLFHASTVEHLATHYVELLEQLASAGEDVRLAELTLSVPTDHADPVIYPFVAVTDRIAAQAARNPNAEAVVCEEDRLSYGGLDAWANRIAGRLQALGVGPDDRVGLAVERSTGLIAALLGIMKAGAAYVPLDPSYPADRLAHMIEDSAITRVVTDAATSEALADLLAGRDTVLVDEVDTDSADPAGGPVAAPEPVAEIIHPDQLAYVIYTSGSTGLPKGVGVTHANAARLLDATAAWYDFGPSDVWTMFHSYAFDFSVWEIFGALAHGGRLVVVPQWLARDTAAFHALLRSEKVTVLNQTPSAFLPLAHIDAAAQEPLTDLRFVIFGGEKLEPAALASWLEARGETAPQLVNMYGITETTVHVTYRPIGLEETRGVARSLIGQPMPDLSLHLLDADLNPVPTGAVGELFVGGAGLARGYLGRPGLTAERFIPDPAISGGRLYRSGDLARRLADGDLDYIGRNDFQVKIRGHRIELGEIQAALLSHAGVREVAVVALDDATGGKRLCAYVVAANGDGEDDAGADAVTAEALRSHLGDRLPAYMVPASITFIDAMPLTVNGKLDRRALPDPELAAASAYVAPRSGTEATLCAIWQEVLGLAKVGINDNFFEIGGDSILSLQIVARARKAGLGLTPRQIFETPRIAELARLAGGEEVEGPALVAVEGEVALTPIQRLFFERQGGQNHWNQSVLLTVRGELDVAALERALDAIVERHDALRLHFMGACDEDWHQWLFAHEKVPVLEVIDLRKEADWKAGLEREGERLQRSLDITQGQLIRAGYFQVGEAEGRLLLAIHHLAVDGVSWRVLFEDLPEAYEQAIRGETIALPETSTPWSVWAARLADYAASPAVTGELDWWKEQLADASDALPLEGEGDTRTGAARSVGMELDRETTRRLLQEVPRAYRMRIDEVLLTALAQTVADWTGGAGALIHLEGHGREDVIDGVDLSRTVGWFTTLFPLWLPADGEAGRALVGVKERLRTIPTKGLHWGLIRYGSNQRLAAAAAALPVPRISFNYLGQFDQALNKEGRFGFAGEARGSSLSPEGANQYVLNLNGMVSDGRLSFSWTYMPGALSQETVERLVATFKVKLAALIDHSLGSEPTRTASDFALSGLRQAELERLSLPLAEIQDIYPATDLQQGLLFHGLLEEGKGVYVTQLRMTLSGALDKAALVAAWQTAIERHDILRTHFEWRHGGLALQVVHRKARLPFAEHDWSKAQAEGSAGQDAYEARLADWLQEDLARGFNSTQAPLMRVNLFIRPDGRHDHVWTCHHALMDGWASAQLLGEVMAAYTRGRDAELPAVAPYRDYIAWLQRQPSAEDWWRARLAEVADPVTLTAALEVSAGEEQTGQDHAEIEQALGAGLSERLRRMAQRHQLTLATLMQGAWAILLARYGGRSQVAYGVTVSGRPAELAGVETMIGLFINSLPVLAEVRGDQSLGPWLAHLQALNIELRQYEHTALSDVQRWAGRSGDALFDTLFVFENYPVDVELRKSEAAVTIDHVASREQPHYPLTVSVLPGDDLILRFSRNGGKITRTAVERLATHYVELLEQLASAGEDVRLAELTLSVPTDHADPVLYPFVAVTDRIAAQAARNPNAEAVVCEEDRLSYGGLDAWANRIAGRLQALGVGPDDRVGLAVERSTGLIAALLGIMKAGAAYVPLDPSYPADRLAHMIEDSAITRVVTDAATSQALADLLAGRDTVLVDEVDTDSADPAGGPVAAPEPVAEIIHPDQLAYVIYTSGSTGLPKGVGVTHANAARLLDATAAWYDFGPSDVWTMFHSYAFDFSVWEIFGALAHGGRLVVVPQWLARDTAAFHALLRSEKVTVLNQTPSAFLPLAHIDAAAQEPLTDLRFVIFGGEKLEPAALASWLEARGETAPQLVNMYGITETTVHVTYRPIGLEETRGVARSLIGQPMPDLSLHLLDADLNPVPTGAVGELFVGGAGLARGYLGRPGLTAERFIPDPAISGGRLYRSGDLARRLADGDLDYIGRNDFQVKIRGHRIELGEIQAALLSHAGVREVAVVALDDATGGKRLCAYVVAANGDGEDDAGADAVTAEALRSHLGDRLPAYMVPASITFIDAMPLTVNGKLDRRALPDPELAAASAYVAPRSGTEATLCAIWQEVLGLAKVGINDNFFEIGGHSLSLMRMLAQLDQKLGVTVRASTFVTDPTIASLATHVADNPKDRLSSLSDEDFAELLTIAGKGAT